METKENVKKKGKRSVSVLTVFIWLALIVVMSVITVSGIRENNAIKVIKPNVIFKLKIEGISEEELDRRFEYYQFGISSYENLNRYIYSLKDGEYYVYTLDSDDNVFSDNELKSIIINQGGTRFVDGYDCYTEFEINGKKYDGNSGRIKIQEIGELDISTDGEVVIYVTNKYIKNDDQGITKSSKWINKDQGIAQIKLQYIPALSQTMYKEAVVVTGSFYKGIIYFDKLSDEFELSSEYITNDEWSILESVADSDNMVPDELFNEFFVEFGIPTGKKYVYVKSTNTIYWYIDKNELSTASNIDTFTFNIAYKGINNEEIRDEMLDTNELARSMISTLGTGDSNIIMVISSPKLEYIRKREAIIKINKEVIGEEGSNTYYVGLFTDETSDKTDKITKIDTVDGRGSGTIEIAEYNLEDKYYVYEVDENGNKISDEKLNYNRNNVIFEKANSLSIREITSNKEVVSEYISTDMTGVDLGRGTGEENYIDNVLSIRDVYEDSITISSEEIKYKVTYEAEEGGIIEGETKEQVYPGEYPQNVPTPKPNEGYEFIRWEVEENGERIEVIPSKYQINKDTVFYAIFEKIPVEKPVDTSDINVGVYVMISLIAVVGIVGVVFFVVRSKKKK